MDRQGIRTLFDGETKRLKRVRAQPFRQLRPTPSAMPRIMPDERSFSIPSTDVGGDVRRNRAFELLAVGAIVDPFA